MPKQRIQKFTGLSAVLKRSRNNLGLSVRAVAAESHGLICNAYVSQIENGYVQEPSPHVLRALAEIYDLNYETLMTLAGYLP